MRTLMLLIVLLSVPLLTGCVSDDFQYPQSGGWFDDEESD